MKESVYIPPLKIQGIKTKLVPVIKKHVKLSNNTVWVEPFMGSGIVGFNIAPRRAIFADINPYIINFYDSVKSGKITSDAVREYLQTEGKLLAENDAEHYYRVRERFNANGDPLDFLFLNRACFNGVIRFNKNDRFNVPYGHKPQRFAKAYITKICNQVAKLQFLLRDSEWDFVCQSFEKTIEEAPTDSFIYCDPPYIGRHVDYYDSWDEARETALKDALLKSGKPFMLSSWDHNSYRKNNYLESIWGFCQKINVEHFYHVGAREQNRNPMVEAILTNYPIVDTPEPAQTSSQASIFDII